MTAVEITAPVPEVMDTISYIFVLEGCILWRLLLQSFWVPSITTVLFSSHTICSRIVHLSHCPATSSNGNKQQPSDFQGVKKLTMDHSKFSDYPSFLIINVADKHARYSPSPPMR
jgi:hypothetical protein